jgi:hypothetical protein
MCSWCSAYGHWWFAFLRTHTFYPLRTQMARPKEENLSLYLECQFAGVVSLGMTGHAVDACAQWLVLYEQCLLWRQVWLVYICMHVIQEVLIKSGLMFFAATHRSNLPRARCWHLWLSTSGRIAPWKPCRTHCSASVCARPTDLTACIDRVTHL